jgi:hypothetical protein
MSSDLKARVRKAPTLRAKVSTPKRLKTEIKLGAGGTGGGVTVHGDLTGLESDDHLQYLTDARADARYYSKTAVDASFEDLGNAVEDLDAAIDTLAADVENKKTATDAAIAETRESVTELAIELDADVVDLGAQIGDAKNRANHTGAQAIATVAGLQTALDAKAALASGVPIGGVAGAILRKKTATDHDTEWAALARSLYADFGGGTDGDVTISSGNVIVQESIFYNNLTINGTGTLNPNGQLIFVKNTLDLTNAPVAAIARIGVNGANTNTGAGAPGGSQFIIQTIGGSLAGSSGGTGIANGGPAGAVPTQGTSCNGGTGGAGGAGGAGLGGPGGASRTGSLASGPDYGYITTSFLKNTTMTLGGAGGAGGSAGGGDGTVAGGGGGGGGGGGAVIVIYARKIKVGPSTPVGVIQTPAGNGGSGRSFTSVLNAGCGGGGGGGGGGWIQIYYEEIEGTAVKAVTANGGNGGNGGSNTTTGGTPYSNSGGDGGAGGVSGRIRLYRTSDGYARLYPPVGAQPGQPAPNNLGGAGGAGGKNEVDLTP